MENIIQILPEFLSNQIAAGEVVQRPESVVKELVENALDAGADTIAVFIKNAGKTYIQVNDNGSGMTKDDLLLAPIRHATSKIKSQRDLLEIKTFGFRGEAIPSIASVSLLEIKTRHHKSENQNGWHLISDPQKKPTIEQISFNKGTQIIVQNLFYNIPARKKFLKSNLTEQKHIYDSMFKFAVSHPDVRFIFYDNDNLIFEVKPEPLHNRIMGILKPRQITEQNNELIEVNYTVNDIKISGYVGNPQSARKTNYIQFLFLNRRSIYSKNLSYAIFTAFEHLIDKNTKPFFVINIEADYSRVDVNVHPQKSEVKFEDEGFFFSIIKKAVSDALKLNNYFTDTRPPISNQESLVVDKTTGEILSNSSAVPHRSNIENIYSSGYNNSSRYSHNRSVVSSNYSSKFHHNERPGVPISSDTIHQLYSPVPLNPDKLSQNTDEQQQTNILHPNTNSMDNLDIVTAELWQYHNKYILIQVPNGLLAVDQHNAQERYIYETLLQKYANENVPHQVLMFETTLTLNSVQMLALTELRSDLLKLGFSYSTSDDHPDRIIIKTQPMNTFGISAEELLVGIIDSYINKDEISSLSQYDRMLATTACKASVKAGQRLSVEEMRAIVTNLLKCEMQYVCPHGRPIIVFFPISEWDRQFGRPSKEVL